MAEARHWYLLLYDVRDEARLRRTHKVMKAWGKPVQYSVFRARCTQRELERLRFELARVMDEKDALMVVRLCASCAQRVTVRGGALSELADEGPTCFIV